jgi:hypothetical protein
MVVDGLAIIKWPKLGEMDIGVREAHLCPQPRRGGPVDVAGLGVAVEHGDLLLYLFILSRRPLGKSVACQVEGGRMDLLRSDEDKRDEVGGTTSKHW